MYWHHRVTSCSNRRRTDAEGIGGDIRLTLKGICDRHGQEIILPTIFFSVPTTQNTSLSLTSHPIWISVSLTSRSPPDGEVLFCQTSCTSFSMLYVALLTTVTAEN